MHTRSFAGGSRLPHPQQNLDGQLVETLVGQLALTERLPVESVLLQRTRGGV